KYSVKYRCTTCACVSMKPASKWHLNITSTSFTCESGTGAAERVCKENEVRGSHNSVPPTMTADVRNSRRCMDTRSDQKWKRHQFYRHLYCRSFSKDACKIKRAGESSSPFEI